MSLLSSTWKMNMDFDEIIWHQFKFWWNLYHCLDLSFNVTCSFFLHHFLNAIRNISFQSFPLLGIHNDLFLIWMILFWRKSLQKKFVIWNMTVMNTTYYIEKKNWERKEITYWHVDLVLHIGHRFGLWYHFGW